tara:strand:+ start:14401 stop:15057 length:657 start_codon:yes stop_codon:yes gene_type:complete
MAIKTHGRMVADGSITSTNIADDAVTSTKILDGSITGVKIADNSVSGTKIADASIVGGKIADNAVTGTKIALGGDTTGDIMYYNGTDWVRSPTNLSFPGGTAPYDISFIAGYDSDTVKNDVEVKTYGEMVMSRTGVFDGQAGYIDTVCTGTVLICDVLKNGTSIYSTKPQFAISTSVITAGVLSTTTFSSGDRITFKVTQIGSSTTGQGVRFMLNCRV